MRLLRPTAIALLSVLSARSGDAAGTRWAVLVGVNDYVELDDLQYAASDMKELRGRLIERGFPKDHIVLLSAGARELKLQPLRANISRQIELTLKLAGADDLVLLAFSGHGVFADGESYLCPSEAQIDRPQETMISVRELYQLLRDSPAALKLMLVDACRDDPRPPGRKSASPQLDNQQLTRAFARPPEGVLVLSSCGDGQISFENDELKGGVFMHFVLAGLAGEADGNRNGKVSLNELYEFAAGKTKTFVARQYNAFQAPALEGRVSGAFEFSLGDDEPAKLAADLIAYIEKLGEVKVQSTDEDEQTAEAVSVLNGVVVTADKVLALPATDEQLLTAVRWKLRAFELLEKVEALSQWPSRDQFLQTLRTDERIVLRDFAQLQLLLRDVGKWNDFDTIQRANLLIDIQAYFTGRSPESGWVPTFWTLASSSLNLPERALAAQTIEVVLPRFKESDVEALRKEAVQLEGMLRLLRVVGTKVDINGTELNGAPFRWNSVQGQPVLVYFSHLCSNCHDFTGKVAAQWVKRRHTGLRVVVVCVNNDRNAVAEVLKDQPSEWKVLFDERGWDHPAAVHYGLQEFPAMFLVDRTATVTWAWRGGMEEQGFDGLLAGKLAKLE